MDNGPLFGALWRSAHCLLQLTACCFGRPAATLHALKSQLKASKVRSPDLPAQRVQLECHYGIKVPKAIPSTIWLLNSPELDSERATVEKGSLEASSRRKFRLECAGSCWMADDRNPAWVYIPKCTRDPGVMVVYHILGHAGFLPSTGSSQARVVCKSRR